MSFWYKTETPDGLKSIQELPMQSLILNQTRDDDNDRLILEGIAWGGGSGEDIAKVEVRCVSLCVVLFLIVGEC